MKISRFIPIALILLPMILFGQSASDQASPLSFTPPPSDLSVKYLEAIFGYVDGMLYGVGSQIMGKMFGVFNSAVLALGGILLMYTLLVSTLNTAHEGEMLGKKFNSAWVPLRSVAAVALLLPKASGYCVMQILVMWVILQGIGAADRVWEAALNYLATGGVLVAPTSGGAMAVVGPDGVQDKSAQAKKLLRSIICMHAVQRNIDKYHDLASEPDSGLTDLGVPPNLISSVDFNTACAGIKNGDCYVPLPYLPNASGEYANLNGICGTYKVKAITSTEITTLMTNLTASMQSSSTSSYSTQKLQDLVNRPNDFGSSSGAWGPNYQTNFSGNANWEYTLSPPSFSWNISAGSAGTIDPSLYSALTEVISARMTAAQQIYIELQPIGMQIVENYYAGNMGDYSNDQAGTVSDYLPLGQLDPSWSSDNVLWVAGGQYGFRTPILTGFELDNAVNAYYAITLSSLRALSGPIENVDFIIKAKQEGWITAGSHLMNLISIQTANEDISVDDIGVLDVTGGFPTVSTQNNRPYLSASYKYGSGQDASTEFPSSASTATFNFKSISALSSQTNDSSASTAMEARYLQDAESIANRSASTAGTGPTITAGLDFEMDDVEEFSDCIGGSIMGWCPLKDAFNLVIRYVVNDFIVPLLNILLDALELLLSPITSQFTVFFNLIIDMTTSEQHPIISLASFGTNFIDVGTYLWIGGMAFAMATIASPVSPTQTNLMVWIVGIFVPMIGALFVFGLTLSFYLPMVPYIIFLMGALGWIVGVIEAMVAAPIVAFGLAHPEAQSERFGRAEPAVNLMLNLFLRPPMMIIGFIGGILLSQVTVFMLNTTFGTIINPIMANATNFASFWGPFFAIGLYITILVMIVQKSFDLIHLLPDKVLSWIGHSGAPGAGGEFVRAGLQEAQQGFQAQAGTTKASMGASATPIDKVGKEPTKKGATATPDASGGSTVGAGGGPSISAGGGPGGGGGGAVGGGGISVPPPPPPPKPAPPAPPAPPKPPKKGN